MPIAPASTKSEVLGTGLGAEAVEEITAELRPLLADVFALYLKTKNFHWHISGSHFRDYHLLLDEQADQIFAIRTRLLNVPARLVERHCTRSARFRNTND